MDVPTADIGPMIPTLQILRSPLHDLLQPRVPVIKRVPLNLRAEWACVLSDVVKCCGFAPSKENMAKLLIVTKCTLLKPPKGLGGKKYIDHIRRRFDLWRNGDIDRLWHEVRERAELIEQWNEKKKENPNPSTLTPEEEAEKTKKKNVKRCEKLIGVGDVGKAASVGLCRCLRLHRGSRRSPPQ